MTRSELIIRLATRFPQRTASEAELAVKTILKALTDQLARGGRAEIRRFGSFSVQARLQRSARNPKTGETVFVPEKHTPYFKTSTELRKRVNSEKLKNAAINQGGRPATNGAQPGWMLLRASVIIDAFTQARNAREKYEFALAAAVQAAKEFDPHMKASPSMVKKILKEFMPEDGEEVLSVTKITEPANSELGTAATKTSYGIGFGPKTTYIHPGKKNKNL